MKSVQIRFYYFYTVYSVISFDFFAFVFSYIYVFLNFICLHTWPDHLFVRMRDVYSFLVQLLILVRVVLKATMLLVEKSVSLLF